MIAILIILIVIVVVLSFVFAYKIRERKLKDFVSLHSVALKNLRQLNAKVHLFPINFMEEKHAYDNKNMFEEISCEDYLIYQLQFRRSAVTKDINLSYQNEKLYEKYAHSLDEIKKFGVFDKKSKYKQEKLISIEQRLFQEEALPQPRPYTIKVTLFLTNLYGSVRQGKTNTFNTDKIKAILNRLANKNGTFYNDRGIWEAICRVERGRVSNKMRFAIYARDGYRCCHCGRNQYQVKLEIDHIKPISKGGKSEYDNLQTLCEECNKKKGNDY